MDEDKLLMVVFSTCIVILTVIRIIYEKTKMKTIIPESALLIAIGLLIGGILVLIDTE
jgi:hydrogenase-4 membrane subunit HyfE